MRDPLCKRWKRKSVNILSCLRVSKLESFGPEPKAILNRFAEAFGGDLDINFWNKVCY